MVTWLAMSTPINKYKVVPMWHLVGGFNSSETYESQLGWWTSQYMETIKVMFQSPPTRHLLYPHDTETNTSTQVGQGRPPSAGAGSSAPRGGSWPTPGPDGCLKQRWALGAGRKHSMGRNEIWGFNARKIFLHNAFICIWYNIYIYILNHPTKKIIIKTIRKPLCIKIS